MSKIKYLISLSVVLIFLAAYFAGSARFAPESAAISKKVVEPFVSDIYIKTVATGKIVPRNEVEIKTQVSGIVEYLYVDAGENIKKGALIARIELIPDMEVLSDAETLLEKSKISFQSTKNEFKRQENLYVNKLISESEFNQFQSDYELVKETVRGAENKVALIKDGVSNESGKASNLVKATTAGMVLDLPVKKGVYVTETNTFNDGTTIAYIADMSDLIFEGSVDESEVAKLKSGMAVSITPGALEGEVFDAVLEYVSPKGFLDKGIIKFEIRAKITQKEGVFLRAGYSANANIILDSRLQVLCLNEGDVIMENGAYFVDSVSADGEVIRKKIEIGISDGIKLEVVSGLIAGEKLIDY